MKWLSNGGINRSWNTFLSFILFSLSTDSADNLSPAGFDVVEKKGEIDSTTKIIRSPSTISINLFPIFREDRPTTWFLLNCILIKIERRRGWVDPVSFRDIRVGEKVLAVFLIFKRFIFDRFMLNCIDWNCDVNFIPGITFSDFSENNNKTSRFEQFSCSN